MEKEVGYHQGVGSSRGFLNLALGTGRSWSPCSPDLAPLGFWGYASLSLNGKSPYRLGSQVMGGQLLGESDLVLEGGGSPLIVLEGLMPLTPSLPVPTLSTPCLQILHSLHLPGFLLQFHHPDARDRQVRSFAGVRRGKDLFRTHPGR